MRRRALIGLFGLYSFGAAAGGCATNTGSSEEFSRSCEGAALDAGGLCRGTDGRFAPSSCCTITPPVKYACDVVDVNHALNADLLEESLVSLYDLDDEGYLNGDEGGTGADLQIGVTGQAIWLGKLRVVERRRRRHRGGAA